MLAGTYWLVMMLTAKWTASRRSSDVYTGYQFNSADGSPANEHTTNDEARLVIDDRKL